MHVQKHTLRILSALLLLILLSGGLSCSKSSFASKAVSETQMNNMYHHSSQASDIDILTPPSFPETFNYEMNVIFLGFNQSRINEDVLLDCLPEWYAPLDGMVSGIQFDINFSLSYNLIFSDQDEVLAYKDFLSLNSEENLAPMFVQPEYSTSRYIHSSCVERYLVQHFMDDATPTLIIIDTFTSDPFNHEPYYYNATYNELDAEIEGWTTNPLPWASTYHIAGGGENSRLLWLDLSAGPTEYEGYVDDSINGVEENARIWDYAEPSDAQLTQDLVKYIAQAIECRFLPSSYLWEGYAYEEVKMEVLLVDLANSDYAFEERLKLDYMVSEYSRVIPFVEWTYSISEWNWQEDSLFEVILEASRYSGTQTYDPVRIMEYWDAIYTDLFNQSSKRRLVIPIFLMMIPSDWCFDPDFGGFARNVDGEFAYIYGKQNENYVDPNVITQIISPITELHVEGESFFNFSEESGYFIEEIEITIDDQNETISAYLLDDYGYCQFKDGLPFNDLFCNKLENISSLSDIRTASVILEIYGNYHFVIENTGTETVSLNCTVKITGDRCIGYTWKIMHEVGHALGLNHPHDAFSWGNYDHPDAESGMYLNWLWDMSYSQMNYANQAPTISLMDIDILQRECTPRYWQDAIQNISNLVENLTNLPTYVNANLDLAIQFFDESVVHYSDLSNIQNYNESLEAVFQMWDAINANETLVSSTDETDLNLTSSTDDMDLILIIGIGVLGGVCLIAIIFVVMKKKT